MKTFTPDEKLLIEALTTILNKIDERDLYNELSKQYDFANDILETVQQR